MSTRAQVAVIGLGAMGLPIARNLVKAGIKTQVWNRSAGPAEKSGAEIVASLSKINAHTVLTSLPDMPQVREVLSNGLQTAMRPGDILVVLGTVSPIEMKALQEEMLSSGIKILDAPMSGGVPGATSGTMSIMVGGLEETFIQAKPIFDVIGGTVLLLGPLGSGQLAKASNQIIVAVTLAGICEAITLARRSGLDTSMVFELLSTGLAGSRVLDQKRDPILNKDYSAGGRSKFLIKDLAFALDAAKATETQLPFTELAQKIYTRMVDHGDGDLDISAVIEEFARLNRKEN